jgi:SsrA-binding protein
MSITTNKLAYHDYHVLDTFEAGLVLAGPEVKAVKAGGINLKGSYISINSDREAVLVKAHISAYSPAHLVQRDYDPYRERKLLLNKKELKALFGKSKESGITIVPLKIYLSHGLVKLEIGVARGKKKHDKRDDIKKRDFNRRKRQLTA